MSVSFTRTLPLKLSLESRSSTASASIFDVPIHTVEAADGLNYVFETIAVDVRHNVMKTDPNRRNGRIFVALVAFYGDSLAVTKIFTNICHRRNYGC